MRLELTLGYPAGNTAGEMMETTFVPYLQEAGISLRLTPLEINDLLDQFYHRTERTADMLYLGTNFDLMFDPAAHFSAGQEGSITWDFSEAEDETLYQLALEMRRTEPGDLLGYCRKWLAFQKRFAEVVPMIPLYSNVYFDYFPRILQNYSPSGSASWSDAVLNAYLSDAQEEPEEENLEEGEEIFE